MNLFSDVIFSSPKTSLHYTTHRKQNKSSLRNGETVCGMLDLPMMWFSAGSVNMDALQI